MKEAIKKIIKKEIINNEEKYYIDMDMILEEIEKCYNMMDEYKKDKSEKFEDLYLINCKKTQTRKELDFLYNLMEAINENYRK
jgi:hypothetical protein